MNRAPIFVMVAMTVLSGCGNGEDACEAFKSAQEDCYSTSGMEPEFSADCSDTPKDEVDRYECLADLYTNAECSSSDTMPSQDEAEACE